jgi:hypothetical protein
MSIHVCCDLCGRPLGQSASGQEVIRLQRVGRHLDGHVVMDRWQVHLCTGRDGSDDSSCLRRAIGLFDKALEENRPDLGLEWRLVPADADGGA